MHAVKFDHQAVQCFGWKLYHGVQQCFYQLKIYGWFVYELWNVIPSDRLGNEANTLFF